MAVVSNTTPLNYLVQIGHPDLLFQLFGQVLIPRAVVDELTVEATPDVVRRWVQEPPSWIEIRNVNLTPDDTLLRLHPGEREAIVLAQTLALPLLVDERAARQDAKRRGVTIVGTLRALDEGAERGLLDFASALSRLRATTFYISTKVLDPLFKRDRERVNRRQRSD